jgi:ankyrin repeat protein
VLRNLAVVGLMLVVAGCFLATAAYADGRQPATSQVRSSERSSVALGKGDLYALVVGLSRYRDGSVPKLDLSDKDAQAFGDFLQSQNKVFKETKVTYLLNEKATKAEVEKYLYYTLPKAGKDDTIILFFSGHGAYDPVRPDDFLFLTYDSEPAYVGTTAVKLSGMAFLKGVAAERVLIIADACRNPGGLSDMKPKALIPSMELFLQEAKSSSGKVVITSTKDGQLSWEIPNLKNSVFTHNLLEGMRGKADKDHDGIVTLNEAYEYAYAMTKEATKGYQHPQFEGRVVGQFPISYVGQALAPAQAKRGLYEAVKTGNSEKIEQLLNAGTDVDIRDSANDTPLIASGRSGQESVIKLLLSRGADPAAVNHELMSPLAEAARNGHQAAVRLFVGAGVDLNGKNQEGLTPLGLATQSGHIEVVQQLLKAGADVKTRAANGQTVLMLAASNGHLDMTKLLIKRDADLDATDLVGKTALIHAAQKGQADTVRYLLSQGAKIEMKQGRYLDLELVRSTLASDANRIKELLAVGAAPNGETASGDTPLTLACALGNAKAARALIATGADVNLLPGSGQPALMVAAAAGRADMVQLLIAGGAQVDLQDKQGNSALVLAASGGHGEALNELLNKLPAYSTAVEQKNLALIGAADHGATEAVRILIGAGADVNGQDKAGDTPLIRAARKGHQEVVKLLVAKEADIDARNQQKCTALMAASQQGRSAVVKQLLVAGADASAQDWEGKTAAMLASERGLKHVVELFKAK